MSNRFSRTELLFGREAMDILASSRVAVFGVGGVGGYVAEALARCGIGAIDIIDNDKVCLTNINRQILATSKTVGLYKIDVAEERIHSINPNCVVTKHRTFFMPDTADVFDFNSYDYVVDAIDTVTGKIELVLQSQKANVPIISCMGTGNKLDPTMLEVSDIYKTSVCPLARVMRTELKKRNVKKLKVVYSKEIPLKPQGNSEKKSDNNGICPSCEETKSVTGRAIPGSNAFVPPTAGLIIAGEVVKDLIRIKIGGTK